MLLSVFLFNLLLAFGLFLLVNSTNVLFSVLLLVVVALLFAFHIIQQASVFVGLLYLAIYVGAVVVFILFVVMMTDLSVSSEVSESSWVFVNRKFCNSLVLPGLTVVEAVLVSGLVVCFVNLVDFAVSQNLFCSLNAHLSLVTGTRTHTVQIASDLFNQHLGPFLVLGLVILLTLIGSIFIIIQEGSRLLPDVGLGAHFAARVVRSGSVTKSQDMDQQLIIDSRESLTLTNIFLKTNFIK